MSRLRWGFDSACSSTLTIRGVLATTSGIGTTFRRPSRKLQELSWIDSSALPCSSLNYAARCHCGHFADPLCVVPSAHLVAASAVALQSCAASRALAPESCNLLNILKERLTACTLVGCPAGRFRHGQSSGSKPRVSHFNKTELKRRLVASICISLMSLLNAKVPPPTRLSSNTISVGPDTWLLALWLHSAGEWWARHPVVAGQIVIGAPSSPVKTMAHFDARTGCMVAAFLLARTHDTIFRKGKWVSSCCPLQSAAQGQGLLGCPSNVRMSLATPNPNKSCRRIALQSVDST